MKADKIDNRQEELFQPRLGEMLNQRHELLILSSMISWSDLEVEFANLYCSDDSVSGHPPKPIRLMIGILLLQHLHGLSDERVVRVWVENPYWQFFCGYDFLQWNFPINPSSLTRFRNRVGLQCTHFFNTKSSKTSYVLTSPNLVFFHLWSKEWHC